jgi:hypothetical protein
VADRVRKGQGVSRGHSDRIHSQGRTGVKLPREVGDCVSVCSEVSGLKQKTLDFNI